MACHAGEVLLGILPMMAWPTNDGCCPLSIMYSGHFRGKAEEDSRKTARGASSPAKPALHIPDLTKSAKRATANTVTRSRFKRLMPPYWRTCPLSMTRAATSSKYRHHDQQSELGKVQRPNVCVVVDGLPSMTIKFY